jgi:hypothetical protein
MDQPRNPLARLDRKELVWFFGILKDACRERLEKNLVNQEFEKRSRRRGAPIGRLDPRPFLETWEPRYRKFLEVATEIHSQLQGEDARHVADALRSHFEPGSARLPTTRRRRASPGSA